MLKAYYLNAPHLTTDCLLITDDQQAHQFRALLWQGLSSTGCWLKSAVSSRQDSHSSR